MSVLRQKRDEALAHPFPLTADLPDEFDDLHFEWTDLRGILMSAVEKALRGERLTKADIEPNNVAQIRKRLRELRAVHPEVADVYTEPFRGLEALLRLLKDCARAAPPKGS